MTGIKRAERTIAKKVYLPESLAGTIDLLLVDDMRRKPRYGAFSQLVTKLLNEYLAQLKSAQRARGNVALPPPSPEE
jgi:hypothetical protein